ncbi:MFS transporter [Gaiella occulta]|uniref:MFS transporter n=1 Tax=Gaiella occulta TaxID=1002870 RepID=UPI000E0B38EB|nr:MFS transporter [Gaiella occulta]
MFLLPSILVGIVVALAAGGDLNRLAAVDFRRPWLVVVALGVQVALFSQLGSHVPGGVRDLAHVGTYLLLIAFGLANRRIRALALMLAGTVMNALVVAVNGGRMPLSPGAAEAAGISPQAYANVSQQASRLRWLGDVFALPDALPLANVFSLGDLLIGVGAVWLIAAAATVGVEARIVVTRRLLEPLRLPEVARLTAGKFVSQVGDWLTIVALVGWIYSRGASTSAVALLLLVRMAPPVVGGSLAVFVVERLPVARLLPAVELARGLIVAAALAATLAGSEVLVITALALSGILAALSAAATPAVLPSIVAPNVLVAANAAIGMTKSLAMAVGAGAGALALARFGVVTSLVIDIATFAVAFALFARLRIADTPRSRAAARRQRPFERVRYLVSHRQSGLLILCFSVATYATGLTNASLPRYFDHLGGPAASYGFAIGALAAGLTAGEIFVASTSSGSAPSRWIGLGLLGMAVLFAMMAGTTQVAMAVLLLAGVGFIDGTTDVFFDTTLQQTTESSRLATVFGASAATTATTMVLGVASAPLLAGVLAPPQVFGVVALALAAAGAIGLLAASTRPAPVPSPAAAEEGG